MAVELVGPNLRVTGRVALGRFNQLSDLVNHNRGFISIHGARVLFGQGAPGSVDVDELLVNQDEITFIGHADEPTVDPAGHSGSEGGEPPASPALDRFALDKQLRHFVIFTPGHTIGGLIHVYREMTLANFVEATDPRFLPMSEATARPLADPGVAIAFDILLVNRTQISAIAETDQATAFAPGGTEPSGGSPAGSAGARPGRRSPGTSPGSW